ncbi:NADP-dependent oxidoreductase [Mycolicibacterium goodii]|uniref:NADP-dependent oxidoreductase n=1 Tax=Mycolicibacterium goodii TaxID=134601 RepID=UPI001BDBFA84|nr:NADP-dependent oxidoreductase [Mycolicibacterium goodii]MBU8812483.1 NADP-dependent oxidoreductase [Mycolicibacterium goodii]ULN44917.1 NADP-dependent oxidoreductase [Mycolicibacterium goodii]
MSRAVLRETFGGPEVLHVRQIAEPHAGAGEIRVRVRAAGLNPLDLSIASTPTLAAAFGLSLPAGFGCDFAGAVDEIGLGVDGFEVGDRVYGGVVGKAVADFVVMTVPPVPPSLLLHTPDGVRDEVAAALPIPGLTASAAVAAVGVHRGDTVLIGGAAGGVGVLAVQLARLCGATVIGTASFGTFEFLRQLGAEPVVYGPGLAERIRSLAPGGLSAAMDLYGTEAAEAALALGVAPQRICTVAAGPNPPGGVRATGAAHAVPEALQRIAAAIGADTLTVPIAATYPIEQIHDAARMQTERHTHGKIVITF